MTNLIDSLPKVRGAYREDANLSKSNWFGVGGNAKILFRPLDLEDLAFFLKHKPQEIPHYIIGVGSNLLVRDGGIDGVVIKLGRDFAGIKAYDNKIEVGAAFLDYNLAQIAKDYEIGGLEFFSGIPGSVGGAIAMNAGAYGADTASVLEYATALDEKGNIHRLSNIDMGFIYRGNTIPEDWIFVDALLKGHHKPKDLIAKQMAYIAENRENSQPIRTKTTGSSFANPPGMKAWELIEKAGCRGLVVGDAIMSEKHCNFIINQGDATAWDIENLGEEVRRRVKEQSGILLEWEIRKIGDYR